MGDRHTRNPGWDQTPADPRKDWQGKWPHHSPTFQFTWPVYSFVQVDSVQEWEVQCTSHSCTESTCAGE